ncbi:MAG: hypothetical protein ABII90_07545 [Bacteroidota bacterium]
MTKQKGILLKLRKSRIFKLIAITISPLLIIQTAFVQRSYALTSGPTQPEASGFQPVEANQLVDPFTGDFSYNIPLLEIGDYPINLSYNSNVTMDQEASWAGLGWNLNIGVINRTMRGLPDDFNGDPIKREFNIKPNITVGGVIGADVEISGLEIGKLAGKVGAGYAIDLKYNNYTGFSLGQTISPSFSIGGSSSSGSTSFLGSANLSISSGSDGLDIQPSLSFSTQINGKKNTSLGLSCGYGLRFNSRCGLQERTLTSSTFVSQKFTHQSQDNKTKKIDYKSSRQYFGNTKLYGPVTFTPKFDLPFRTKGMTFSFKLGGKIFIAELSGVATGYFSKQELEVNSEQRPAHGYIYLQNGQGNSSALLDFNREKDATFTPGKPNLPLTYLTHDIFNVGAQGIGGTYRAYRNETGFVSDPQVRNASSSWSAGGEIDLGNAVKGGVDLSVVDVESYSSAWNDQNYAQPWLRFKPPLVGSDVKNVYFKRIGEISNSINTSFCYKTGRKQPLHFSLLGDEKQMDISLLNIFRSNSNQEFPITCPIYKNDKPIRQSNPFQVLTVSEVKRMHTYHRSSYLTSSAKDHHIGQIIISREDGKRYVFGLPAYNNLQKEVTFSIEKTLSNYDTNTGLITYDPANKDNTLSNKNGLDHYFDATTIPSYAYAFFLTDVLSPDYVDMTGNGPTPDDIGNYVKVHYSKKVGNYRWRTPVHENKAQFDEGLLSIDGKDGDDKAHYVYGMKDIWYVDTIKTKTQIAIFYISKRDDAYDVINENGGIGPNAMSRLDKISLYNLHDYNLQKDDAFPLKTVHFVYDYSRCQGLPNSTSSVGKLTLLKVYFTYGNSFKGRQSPYIFEYSSFNPNYSMMDYDRWGYYKPDNDTLPNRHFPYTMQNKDSADKYVRAWLLDRIVLPSGGYISMDYESDDYTHVQDKEAMQMFVVAGASNSFSGTLGDELYSGSTNNTYLFFKLNDQSITSPTEATNYVKDLIGNIHDKNGIAKNLYFKFKVNVDTETSGQNKFDYVFGYCELDPITPFGAIPNGGGYYGWVKVSLVPTDGSSNDLLHPIARAAIQFSRLKTPHYAFDQVTLSDIEEDPVQAVIDLLDNASIIGQLIDFANGPNGSLKVKKIGQKFKVDESWIRLLCPAERKLGGGARVQKLTYGNNWNILQPGEDSLTIVQEYEYVLEDGITGSGVASYEPLVGGDEIPHHLPVTYYPDSDQPRWSRMLVPDETFFLEEPFGELAFPPPVVGYSRVTVRNVVPGNISARGTGYTIQEFYTAKDFPVKTYKGILKNERRKKKPLISIIRKRVKDYLTVTQGYTIELNDMHGKPRLTEIYDDDGSPISKIEYKYTLPDLDGDGQNKILVLKSNGKVVEDILGIEEDLVADFREQQTTINSTSAHVNIGTFIWPFPPTPITIPLGLPAFEEEKTRFRSATTTRIIYRYGIMKEQIVTDLGARVTTANLVFDQTTGNPVLTETTNAFNDTIYSFSYPAHNIYSGMDAASLNINALCEIKTNSNGKILSVPSFLHAGDELLSISGSSHAWVHKDNGNYYLIDKNGNPITVSSNKKFVIIRSGHRNILSANAGSVVSIQNPLVKLSGSPPEWEIQFNANKEILDADAVTYRDYWHTPCNTFIADTVIPVLPNIPTSDSNTTNFIITGGGCKCSKNPDAYKVEDFFYPMITGYSFINATPIKITYNSNTLWWQGILNSNNILEGFTYEGAGNPDEESMGHCFTIYDPGADGFNCLNSALSNTNGNISVQIKKDQSNCDGNSFILNINITFPEGYQYLNFPANSHSCYNMFSCSTSSSYDTLSGPAYSITTCQCNKTTFANNWEQVFSSLAEQNLLIYSIPEVIPVGGIGSGVNISACANVLHLLSTFTGISDTTVIEFNGFVQNDSTLLGIITYYDTITNSNLEDTCFIFNDPGKDSLQCLLDAMTDESGDISIEVIPDYTKCDDPDAFILKVTLTYPEGDKFLFIPATSLCGNMFMCETSAPPEIELCVPQTDKIISPYHEGILGNWRKYEDYKLLNDREPEQVVITPSLRGDGYYTTFSHFWNYSSGAWSTDTTNWTRANRITLYSPDGDELENKDALGRYSSALYEHKRQLPTAIAFNAKYKEIAFEGFEDYYSNLFYKVKPNICYDEYHFKFEDDVDKITDNKAHTGLFSIGLAHHEQIEIKRPLSLPYCEHKTLTNQDCYCTPLQFPYKLRTCDCLGLFSPDQGSQEKFVFSFWVLQDSNTDSMNINVKFFYRPNGDSPIPSNQLTLPVNLTYQSPAIEQWQQLQYEFEIPGTASGNLEFQFSNLANDMIYIDDIRIHPFDANMKSFVYNPFSHRLMATLDENNFATFYQYYENGNLQVVRKETERGIVTTNYYVNEKHIK